MMKRILLFLLWCCATLRGATPQELVAQMLPSDLLLPNAAALELSPEQQQRLREKLTPLQREMPPLQKQMGDLNTALVALLAETKPDEDTVLAKYHELEAVESRIKVLRMKMTLVAKSVLSAEQQEKARSLRGAPAEPVPGNGDTIRAKLQRVRDGLERMKREGRDVTQVRELWNQFQQHAERREHQLAMKALNEALALIEAPGKGKN
jgi:hypothetical protein